MSLDGIQLGRPTEDGSPDPKTTRGTQAVTYDPLLHEFQLIDGASIDDEQPPSVQVALSAVYMDIDGEPTLVRRAIVVPTIENGPIQPVHEYAPFTQK